MGDLIQWNHWVEDKAIWEINSEYRYVGSYALEQEMSFLQVSVALDIKPRIRFNALSDDDPFRT